MIYLFQTSTYLGKINIAVCAAGLGCCFIVESMILNEDFTK